MRTTVMLPMPDHTGLASFCRSVEQNWFFHGKIRPGKTVSGRWKKHPGNNFRQVESFFLPVIDLQVTYKIPES